MNGQEVQASDATPAALVHRIGEGDRQAEEILVQKYGKPVFEILRNRTRDPELAADLLQDALIIVILRLRSEGLDQPEKLIGFLHRTAHNLVIGHFRKEGRRNTLSDSGLVEIHHDNAPSEIDKVLQQERSQIVQKLLNELTVLRDKEILSRFYVLGQEKDIVCNALDLTKEQFDRTISRARQRFRALVEDRVSELS